MFKNIFPLLEPARLLQKVLSSLKLVIVLTPPKVSKAIFRFAASKVINFSFIPMPLHNVMVIIPVFSEPEIKFES